MSTRSPADAAQHEAEERLARAMERLKSLHDGDRGVLDVVALGSVAIPPLAALLFAREPSGLFQRRCRAVEALVALKAFRILADFLRLRQDIPDPVERLGEEVVISAAARALSCCRERWVYELLHDFARRHPLQGVLAGLGSFRRVESVPVFVDALQEDELRPTAEAVLRAFGPKARPDLIAAACEPGGDRGDESDSHIRKRKSAIALLAEAGVSDRDWLQLRPLVDEPDHRIVLPACELGMKVGDTSDLAHIRSRLKAIRPDATWMRRDQIDRLLRNAAACDRNAMSRKAKVSLGASPGGWKAQEVVMNIRQLLLDVDKAVARPSLLEIAEALDRCHGVEAVNLTVEEIDIETVGMIVTIEGEDMDYGEIERAIESTGAVVHSLDQVVIGSRVIPHVPRVR